MDGAARRGERGTAPSRWPRVREWLLRGGLLVVLAALLASLAYEGPPPPGAVHTHHAFRLYAHGPWVEFPLFNFAGRAVAVHMEEDELAGDRANEVIHVHRANVTLGEFLDSLTLDASAGHLRLDSPARFRKAVHRGEAFDDNLTHHWRLYVQGPGGAWERAPGDPVDFPAWEFGVAERLLLTYVPRAWPDDHDALEEQRAALLDGLGRWPQET